MSNTFPIDGKEAAIILGDALKNNSSLQSIDFSQNSIKTEGAQAFANALKANTTLRTLNFFKNALGDDAISFIASSLLINKTLQNINISSTGNFQEERDCNATQSLANALRFNVGLRTINLEGSGIRGSGWDLIVDATEANKRIVSIKYSNFDDISYFTEKKLAKNLKHNADLARKIVELWDKIKSFAPALAPALS